MTTKPNNAEETNADPEAHLDVTVTLTVGDVRALLARKDLDPAVATELQSALNKQHPTAEVALERVRKTLAIFDRGSRGAA